MKLTAKEPIIRVPGEFSSRIIRFIPEILTRDGLTIEALQKFVDAYIKNRIEPEVLMCIEKESDWPVFRYPTFNLWVTAVRFINERDRNDEGDITSLYRVWESDDMSDEFVSLYDFICKWDINIKERSWFDSDVFWFVIEFSLREEDNPKMHYTMSLCEDKWWETRFEEERFPQFEDFTLHHLDR